MKLSTHAPQIQRRSRALAALHVGIIGCGNIGSHTIPLAARLQGVRRMTLVDFDRYEAANVAGQNLARRDVGQFKAFVQRRRVLAIDPGIEVIARVDRLENIPMALLDVDVLLTCLDSKAARQRSNELARRLGMLWIDAGIEPTLGLARVDVYFPGSRQPCLECSWTDEDYALLEVRHPCNGSTSLTSPSTSAPASLGALAAALQMVECGKWLSSKPARAAQSYQVILEAVHHQLFVTTLRQNARCRCAHFNPRRSVLRQLPARLSLQDMFNWAGGPKSRARLGLGGMALTLLMACPQCGFTRRSFRLVERMRPRDKACPRCRCELLPAGSHTFTSVGPEDLARQDHSRTLASLGIQTGDILSMTRNDRTQWIELGARLGSKSAARSAKGRAAR